MCTQVCKIITCVQEYYHQCSGMRKEVFFVRHSSSSLLIRVDGLNVSCVSVSVSVSVCVVGGRSTAGLATLPLPPPASANTQPSSRQSRPQSAERSPILLPHAPPSPGLSWPEQLGRESSQNIVGGALVTPFICPHNSPLPWTLRQERACKQTAV